ncbi:hypothetical protein ABZV91_12980 [Nocardia sp. NPDC004568]|uniref:hypothetical protein n=1 Tax=Nocardia sp. NPDC004568 TaxID=3154551 RepID=UPI0033B654F8
MIRKIDEGAGLLDRLISVTNNVAHIRATLPRGAAHYVRAADSELHSADNAKVIQPVPATAGNLESPLPVRRRAGQLERLNTQIANGLTERHGIQTYGFGRPGLDTGTIREIVRAMDNMLAKYPHTRILSIEIGDVDGSIARSFEDRSSQTSLVGTRIAFSTKYASNPRLLSEDTEQAINRGHFSRRSEGPAYSAIVHEFGHALTYEGRSAIVDIAETKLFEYYRRKYSNPESDLEKSYKDWLGKLSGYSFCKGYFHPIEALAEAFADVEMNGVRATEPAKVLHEMLVNSARSEWRKVRLT